MAELFVISDLHLGHANILKFQHEGRPLRPFETLDEMHLALLTRWNETVGPKDKVYVLGDVAMTLPGLEIFGLMNGRKRLVRGNHDNFKLNQYRRFFDEVYGVRQINGVWFTHVPMHQSSVDEPRVKLNVHGHLHARTINHPKYVNVCVEQTDYRPVNVDLLMAGRVHL